MKARRRFLPSALCPLPSALCPLPSASWVLAFLPFLTARATAMRARYARVV
jgi:hypothetical protein